MYVRVKAEVRPTEDIEKVRKAVRNVFNGRINVIDGEHGLKVIIGESDSAYSLIKLHDLIRIYRILDAARKSLQKGMRGNTIVFKLHKQAAYVGKISFIDSDHESPLGSITFYIESSDPGKLIDWLAPKTSMGKPLWEIDMPKE